MTFFKYDKKNLGPYGSKCKCLFCKKNLKNEIAEVIEHVHYIGGDYEPAYFCEGHLNKWIKKQQDEWFFNKL